MKTLIRILQAVVLVAVASSFAHADNFMYFKKKAGAPAGYSDSFTGADATSLATHDANWGNASSTYDVASASIFSNQATGTAHNGWEVGGARYTTSTSDISQIDFVPLPDNNVVVVMKGLLVRGNGTSLGYNIRFANNSGGNWTRINIYKDTTWQEDHNTAMTVTDSHTIKLTAEGTSTVTVKIYIDGSLQHTFVDSTSPISSGNPGFLFSAEGSVAGEVLDNWRDY